MRVIRDLSKAEGENPLSHFAGCSSDPEQECAATYGNKRLESGQSHRCL